MTKRKAKTEAGGPPPQMRWRAGDPPLPVGGFCEIHQEHYKSALCVECRRNHVQAAGKIVVAAANRAPMGMIGLPDPSWDRAKKKALARPPDAGTEAGASVVTLVMTLVLAAPVAEQVVCGGYSSTGALEMARSAMSRVKPLADGADPYTDLMLDVQRTVRLNRRHVFLIADALREDPSVLRDADRLASLTDGIVGPS